MSAPTIPERTQILVIGGGPGGSYTASCLAREGKHVIVFEADKFPRYHIGESTLPSIRNFLRFIDLEKEFDSHGFVHKNGAAFKLHPAKAHGFTDFLEDDKTDYAWNLIRSESDEMMLRHAARCGASVFEETKALEIEFQGDRPVSVFWARKDGTTGRIKFDYLVDASGRNGIMSTKYLKSRTFNPQFKNIAIWGYWKGCKTYKPGTYLEGWPFFEALTDESGWAWFFPLHDGTASVGVIVDQDIAIRTKAGMKDSSSVSYYHEVLKRAPSLLQDLIANGTLVTDRPGPSVRQTSDYSYSASSYAGPYYRIVGDAGCFLDPYFSTGIHLAMSGGLSAAATISASIAGECTEEQAFKWHTARVDTSYTRFLVVVLTAYRQIRDQKGSILSDMKEDNFDRAFNHFCFVIQGTVDVARSLADNETQLRRTLNFCKDAFNSSDRSPAAKLPSHVVASDVKAVEKRMDTESKDAVSMVIAKRFMTTGDSFMIDHIVTDSFDGLRLRLKRGSLGLQKA